MRLTKGCFRSYLETHVRKSGKDAISRALTPAWRIPRHSFCRRERTGLCRLLGSSMALIDGTVVNVAVPAIQSNLAATIKDVQWVIESYALFLAAARLTLHQDKNERDFAAPIVSVSLCLPAVFPFGGQTRNDRPRRIRLESGDIAVWGGPSRLACHGVAPLAEGEHPVTGRSRINLTYRKAL